MFSTFFFFKPGENSRLLQAHHRQLAVHYPMDNTWQFHMKLIHRSINKNVDWHGIVVFYLTRKRWYFLYETSLIWCESCLTFPWDYFQWKCCYLPSEISLRSLFFHQKFWLTLDPALSGRWCTIRVNGSNARGLSISVMIQYHCIKDIPLGLSSGFIMSTRSTDGKNFLSLERRNNTPHLHWQHISICLGLEADGRCLPNTDFLNSYF